MTIQQRPLVQFAINAVYFDEVLKALPENARIESLLFEVGHSLKRHQAVIPTRLKRLGVTYLREPVISMEASGKFEGVSVDQMKRNLDEICKSIGLTRSLVRVKSLLLKVGNIKARFNRCTKEIRPDENDKRRKLIVLGLFNCEGDVNEVAAALTATKYRCTFDVVPVRTVVCEEVE